MKRRIANPRQIIFLFCWLFLCLIPAGCAQVNFNEYFPVPTSRSFPSLTPRPTQTLSPTTTSTLSITPTPTPIMPAEIGTPMAPAVRIISADTVNQLEHFVSRGKGIPQQMIFSPNGNLLAISSSSGVYLYDSATLEQVEKFETGVPQLCISFSANGEMLASCGQDGSIRIWSIEDGSLLHFFYDGILPIISIAFSPGGEWLATSSWDRHIRLWGVLEENLIQTIKVRLKAVEKLAFSPDGELLFAWASKESVQVWQVAEGRPQDDIYIGRDELGNLPIGGTFTFDGALFATNHRLRIRVFLTRNGTTLYLIRDIDDPLNNLVISPNGAFLAGDEGNIIKIWELENGELFQRILPLPSGSRKRLMAFSPGGETLITLDDAIISWNLEGASEPQDDKSETTEQGTSEEEALLEEPLMSGASEFISSYVMSSALSQNQQTLSIMVLGNTLHTFDFSSGKRIHSLVFSDASLSPAAFSPDQNIVAFKDWSNRVSLRETSNGEEIASLEGHSGRVRCLAFSSDGTLIATGGEDNIVFVWRIENGELLNALQHAETPQAISFSPEDSILIVRSRSNIYVWSLVDEQLLHRYRGYSMVLSPDGSLLAVANNILDRKAIEIHQTISGDLISAIEAIAISMAFSPDNSLLAVADTAVTLWQVADGTLIQTLKDADHFGKISFSPDGKLLLLTGWDGALNGWGIP